MVRRPLPLAIAAVLLWTTGASAQDRIAFGAWPAAGLQAGDWTFVEWDSPANGISDVLGYSPTGSALLTFGTNGAPGFSFTVPPHSIGSTFQYLTGDLNADGVDDILQYDSSNGLLQVAVSPQFVLTLWAILNPGPGWRFAVGNLIGAPMEDLLLHNEATGQVLLFGSVGNGFVALTTGSSWMPPGALFAVGPFTGGPEAELLVYDPATDALSLGTYSFPDSDFLFAPWGNAGPRTLTWLGAGEFNADGRLDVVGYDAAGGEIVVGLNDGASFAVDRWGEPPYAANWRFTTGRFTGLPQADVVAYDPATLAFRMGDNVQKQCDNGFDDDGDGDVDMADGGCNLVQLAKEAPQCSDAIDNDSDGLTDFPMEAQCQGAWDDDEATNPSGGCGLVGAEGLLVLAALRRGRRRNARERAPG